MDYAETRQYLLEKPDARESFPFGPECAVFKIKGKMFATLVEEDGVGRTNLKCDPDEALMLRDIFPAILPGYHMNKRHWNTVILDGSVPKVEISRMIDRSYGLVVKGLKKAQRQSLEVKYGEDTIYC